AAAHRARAGPAGGPGDRPPRRGGPAVISRRRPAFVALGVLGAAAVASALLARFLPMPPGEAFRGTLTFLPFLLAGFALLQERTVRLGGRRIPAAVTAGELVALGGLVLLALARARYHLPAAEAPLATGFLLVLA